jgi:ABC-type multidrug transport system permease subunit
MLLASVQILFFLVSGRLLFDVALGDSLGGIVLVLLVYAWVASSLGLWLGAVVRAEEKVVGLGVLSSMVMAALGGCWWPLEIVPDSMQVLAYFFPTGWAMAALHQLISFGAGLGSALRPLGMLALFGLAANVAAIRWFRT